MNETIFAYASLSAQIKYQVETLAALHKSRISEPKQPRGEITWADVGDLARITQTLAQAVEIMADLK